MNKIRGIEVLEDVSLKKYNTYRLEAKCKYLITALTIEGLKEILKYLEDNNIKWFILGNGSNVIMDEYYDGAIIKLDGLNKIKVSGKKLEVEAGTLMPSMAKEALKQGLTGLEWAINIPGSVGGSINNNAGAYNGELFDNLESITVLTKELDIKEINKSDIKYSYRHTNIKELGYIVLKAIFELEKGDIESSKKLIKDRCERRLESQPLDMPSAGSVFRNPKGFYAGKLIEDVGLKGHRIGGAMVSLKHANFIVNTGNATSNDIKSLIKLIYNTIKDKYGIELVLEQEILDWK